MTDIVQEAARQDSKSPNRYALLSYGLHGSNDVGIGLTRFMRFFWYVIATKGNGSSGRFFFRHASADKYFESMKTQYGLKE